MVKIAPKTQHLKRGLIPARMSYFVPKVAVAPDFKSSASGGCNQVATK